MDREAGLESAKLKMVDARYSGAPALLIGQVVLVAAMCFTVFSGTARILVLTVVLLDAVLVGSGLMILRRVRRWWDENRVGTRYETW